MPAPLRLEAFDEPALPAAPPAGPVDEVAVENIRLAAYETGYAAGWEDAISAQSEDQSRIREDLGRNLRDLSFTFQEARTHVLRSLEALLRGMVDRVLPELARGTLGAAVVERVMAEAAGHAAGPVEIAVAPSCRAAVADALGETTALPVRLVEEPSLGEGQVHFRFGAEEHVLDTDALIAAIRALVADYLASSTQEGDRRHG